MQAGRYFRLVLVLSVVAVLVTSCRSRGLSEGGDFNDQEAMVDPLRLYKSLDDSARSDESCSKAFVAITATCNFLTIRDDFIDAFSDMVDSASARLAADSTDSLAAALDFMGLVLTLYGFPWCPRANNDFQKAMTAVPIDRFRMPSTRMIYMAALYEAALLHQKGLGDTRVVAQAKTRLKEVARLVHQEQAGCDNLRDTILYKVWSRAILEGRLLNRKHCDAVFHMAHEEVFSTTPNWVAMIALTQVVRSRTATNELRTCWMLRLREFISSSKHLADRNQELERKAYILAMWSLLRSFDPLDGWVFDEEE